jgi:tetratricopeptide (TPR) repeat protein/O-antigen ligase
MKKITQYISIAALFLVPLFPLIVANSYFFPFITGKAFYFRILVEIAFAAWVILAFLDAKYRPKFTSLNVAVTLFAVIALIADLLGVNPMRSLWSNFERMEGWIVIIHLWAFYITATSLFGTGVEGKKIWHRWMNCSIAVATIISFYGIGQLLGWFAIHQSAARLDATIGNSAYLGIYIIIHMFIIAYMYFAVRADEFKGKPFLSWAYPVLFVFFGFIALETQTRAAVLGLGAGLMLGLLLYTVFAHKSHTDRSFKKSRKVTGIIFAVIVLLGILFIAERKQPFFANSPIFGRLASLSLTEFSKEGRASIWPMAISGGLERPILGWGQENFNYIFNANYAPKMYGQEQWFDRAHSVFLDWFVASGFVGLFAYLSLFILAIITIWKSHSSALSQAKKSVLTGLIVAYAVNNLAVFDNLASYVFFFAVLAFVNSWKDGKHIKVLGTNPVRTDAVEYIVAPIAIILLIGSLYMFNVRPIQANTRLIAALQACGSGKPDATLFESALAVNTYVANQEIREQLFSCASQVVASQQVPNQLKQQFFTLASSEIEAQIKATPKDARIYVLGGSFMNDIGQVTEGSSLLEKAYELSPTKQSIMISLANDYLGAGKNVEAVAILKQAYESATDNFSAKFSYAIGLVVTGKESEARTMFNNDPAIFNTQQMANVFASLKQYPKAIEIYNTLIGTSTKDVNLLGSLAQLQYTAGMKDAAIKTLQGILITNPEYKSQVDAAIKQIQSGK